MAQRIATFIPNERLRADLTLLLVSLVWGSAFVAQRVAAIHMEVYTFNGLRFLLGALVLLPLSWQSWGEQRGLRGRNLLAVFLAGALLFGGTTLQQLGLQFTTAGNAGFITGLYVVLIPLILALGLRRWPRGTVWIASLLAASGLFLLSTGGQLKLAAGDGLELAGALMWAFHVILIGWLVQRVEVFPLAIVQYLVCGLLSLLIGLSRGGLAGGGLREAAWAVAYTGVFSIGLGYTLQAVGQKVAPAADAAIILSTEAAFAALFGWLWLGEQLSALQLLGCGLMLAGMLLAQSNTLRASTFKETQAEPFAK